MARWWRSASSGCRSAGSAMLRVRDAAAWDPQGGASSGEVTMRPVRAIAVVVFAAALAITCCTAHSASDHPSPASRATHPIQPPAGWTDPALLDRQARLYAAVLREYVTSGCAGLGVDHQFPRSFVLDRAVAGAGGMGHGAPMG